MGAAGFEFSFNVSYTAIIHIISIIDIPFEKWLFFCRQNAHTKMAQKHIVFEIRQQNTRAESDMLMSSNVYCGKSYGRNLRQEIACSNAQEPTERNRW